MKNKRDLILSAILLIVLFCVSWFVNGELDSYVRRIVNLCLIYAIIGLSMNVTNGFTGQFSIGHAGFMAVGAYVGAVLTVKMQLPFIVAILGGAAAAGFLGFVIGLPTLRLDGDYLAIATLGLGEIIRITILNIPYVGGASGFMGIPRYTNFTWVFILTVFTVLFIRNFINSTHGRACISVRENQIAAEAMGVDTTKYKVMAFTMGAAFAGVAGTLFAHYFYIAHPASFTFMKSFDILTMMVLGGLGSITGSVVGAIVLTFITAALSEYPEWRMIIYSISLIIMMIYRPQGLLGTTELNLQRLFRLGGAKSGHSANK